MFKIMKKTTTSHIQNSNPNQISIDSCIKCIQMSQERLTMCPQELGVKDRIDCIKTLQDCSEFCIIVASYINRSSESIEEICDEGATICEHCATKCDMFQNQHSQTCANICRQCASECRSMGYMNNLSNKNW